MQIVREFFELNRFHVLTHWHHEDLPRVAEPGSLLFVEHTNRETGPEGPFVLAPEDLRFLHRAVVEVRAWHADRFYASVVEASPVLGHVNEPETRALAQSVFGDPDFTTILVISELPSSTEPRERAVQLLQNLGLGHILEFSTILRDMIERISAHGNYAPSQTLQTMRLLKRYNFIRRQQLEFAFPLVTPRPGARPVVDAEILPDDQAEMDLD